MGNILQQCGCGQGPKRFDPLKDTGDLKLMRAETIKDPLIRFEKSFPFYRMHCRAFINKINEFGKADFDYKLLGHSFDSEAWEGQFKEGTELYKLIKTIPKCEGDSVNTEALSLLAILWCGGSVGDKAEAFYQLIQPPGQN
jgi:hypothetical protein